MAQEKAQEKKVWTIGTTEHVVLETRVVDGVSGDFFAAIATRR